MVATYENNVIIFPEQSGDLSHAYRAISEWFEIRVAEMSGFDYIFAPMHTCNKITDFITLQNFLHNIQTVIRSNPQRTILIGFTLEDGKLAEMDRYDVEWAHELIVDCRRSSLFGSPQREFIEMLFNHSENLVDDC